MLQAEPVLHGGLPAAAAAPLEARGEELDERRVLHVVVAEHGLLAAHVHELHAAHAVLREHAVLEVHVHDVLAPHAEEVVADVSNIYIANVS